MHYANMIILFNDWLVIPSVWSCPRYCPLVKSCHSSLLHIESERYAYLAVPFCDYGVIQWALPRTLFVSLALWSCLSPWHSDPVCPLAPGQRSQGTAIHSRSSHGISFKYVSPGCHWQRLCWLYTSSDIFQHIPGKYYSILQWSFNWATLEYC